MNAIAKLETTALATMAEAELLEVLQSSLYPGANPSSIKLVLGYCKAAGLDPMQKPVHIVPMWDSKAKQMRDVVMPGIGLYRTQAARGGQLAGISEPEFGPEVDLIVGEFRLRHPEWCKVAVTRALPGGQLAHFTACEYWIENYATASKDSQVPNAMWKKRPRGQIAKCAEAQALRKAFPEMTGSQATADEMEGRVIDEEPAGGTVIDAEPARSAPPQTQPQPYPAADFERNLPAWRELVTSGKKTAERVIAWVQTKGVLTEEQKRRIRGEDAVPTATYAEVADRLTRAADPDQLAEAASLIPAVADEQQRAELTALFDRREAEFSTAS